MKKPCPKGKSLIPNPSPREKGVWFAKVLNYQILIDECII